MANYYDVLGVDPDATPEQIKEAYRKRALETHPDRNTEAEAHEEFVRVKAAYETLSDSRARARYDRSRRDPAGGSGEAVGPRTGRAAAGQPEPGDRVRQYYRRRRQRHNAVRDRSHRPMRLSDAPPFVIKYASTAAIVALAVYLVMGAAPIVTVLVAATAVVSSVCILDLLDDVILGGRGKDLLSR